MGYRKEYETFPVGPDETAISFYTIGLSERDVDALRHLQKRNGSGIGNIAVENIALWKAINQICEIDTDENCKKEWICRYCGKSTFETDSDYLVDQTTHLPCALAHEEEHKNETEKAK
jgi:hypothetical protein